MPVAGQEAPGSAHPYVSLSRTRAAAVRAPASLSRTRTAAVWRALVSQVDCESLARGATGLCCRHGGGRRCTVSGCTKAARNGIAVCTRHNNDRHRPAARAGDRGPSPGPGPGPTGSNTTTLEPQASVATAAGPMGANTELAATHRHWKSSQDSPEEHEEHGSTAPLPVGAPGATTHLLQSLVAAVAAQATAEQDSAAASQRLDSSCGLPEASAGFINL